jgi:hypothetical protein
MALRKGTMTRIGTPSVNRLPLGLASGCFSSTRSGYPPLIEFHRRNGCTAIELGCYLTPWVTRFEAEVATLDLRGFSWVSVHAPRFTSTAEPGVARRLAALGLPLVVHADHIVNSSWWRPLGAQVLVENIAFPDRFGATPDSLDRMFEALPQARFCLDVSHAFGAGGPALVHQLASRYAARLAEVHVGCTGVPAWPHDPLPTDASLVDSAFAAAGRIVPVIVERPLPGMRAPQVLDELNSLRCVMATWLARVSLPPGASRCSSTGASAPLRRAGTDKPHAHPGPVERRAGRVVQAPR